MFLSQGNCFVNWNLLLLQKQEETPLTSTASTLRKARSSATRRSWPIIMLLWMHNLLCHSFNNNIKKVYVQLWVCGSCQTEANRLKLVSDRPYVNLSTTRATRKLQIPVLSGVNHLAHFKNVSPAEGQTHIFFPSVWICCQIWQSWHKQWDSLLSRQMAPTESGDQVIKKWRSGNLDLLPQGIHIFLWIQPGVLS